MAKLGLRSHLFGFRLVGGIALLVVLLTAASAGTAEASSQRQEFLIPESGGNLDANACNFSHGGNTGIVSFSRNGDSMSVTVQLKSATLGGSVTLYQGDVTLVSGANNFCRGFFASKVSPQVLGPVVKGGNTTFPPIVVDGNWNYFHITIDDTSYTHAIRLLP